MKLIATFALAGTALLAMGAQANPGYPSKPIRLVVPYTAGGGTDVLARQVARYVGEALNQSVIVDNKPGASTTIAAVDVAKSPADGYTVLWGDSATFAVNRFLFKRLAYDPVKSFEPVTMTVKSTLALSVSSKLPIHTVPELVAHAKANPGKLSYGTPGTGSPHHLFMEAFKQEAGGLDIVHVPYKGEGPAMQEMAGGTIDTMFSGVRTSLTQVEGGKVRMIGLSGPERIKAAPTVQPIKDSGVPSFSQEVWQGVAVPAGTPAPVIAKLHEAFRKASEHPDLLKWVAQSGGARLVSTGPKAMAEQIQAEMTRTGPLVQKLNITLN